MRIPNILTILLTLVLTSFLSFGQAPGVPKGSEGQSGPPALTGDDKTSVKAKGAMKEIDSYPQRYQTLLFEAVNSFQGRDFQGALKYVDKADQANVDEAGKVLPPTKWSLNIRAGVAIETGDLENGAKYCMEALKLDPAYFSPKFNLCEIKFHQKNYAEARASWMKIFEETKRDDSNYELLVYRIFLTYLMEKDFVQAKEWLAKIPFPSETPAYHYGHAAWERQQGNLDKWDEWLKSAVFVWPDTKRSEFTDVLGHLGWLKLD